MTQTPVVVIGGGNGARAFAGHLSLKGARVRLVSSFPAELEAIEQAGSITVSGTVEGQGAVEVCRDNFAAAKDAQLILVVVPAFAISELRLAFSIGFIIFIPFLVIDMVVASILMSMGMFMLPPVMISLPFKILLFVLVDGWYLVVESLLNSFA